MFILKPIQSSLFSKDDIGTVEEVVRETRLVDKGVEELKRFSRNAPSFQPERRKFLKHTAVLAGLIASGKFVEACSPAVVEYGGKSYGNWEAYLLTQDLIRGPGLINNPRTGILSDFEEHKKEEIFRGREPFGAVDYDVPIGTPTVPTADVFRIRVRSTRPGGNVLDLYHRYGIGGYVTTLVHLSEYGKIISKGTPISIEGLEYLDLQLDKLKVSVFSGNTGRGLDGGPQPEHLHFQIAKILNEETIPPGIDPFEAGIDAEKPFGGIDQGINYGGRPVYLDGKTEIVATRFTNIRRQKLQETLDTYPKRVRESNLEKETKEELLKRQNNPEALRDYLGMIVLTKHRDKDGKMNYRYPPGSLLYALALEVFARTSNMEFIATLPFISPLQEVKAIYQKANPDVKL